MAASSTGRERPHARRMSSPSVTIVHTQRRRSGGGRWGGGFTSEVYPRLVLPPEIRPIRSFPVVVSPTLFLGYARGTTWRRTGGGMAVRGRRFKTFTTVSIVGAHCLAA